jgi:SAM-dependent methyltransferase
MYGAAMQDSEARQTPQDAQARFWDRFARRYAAHKLGDPAGYERTLARVGETISGMGRVLEIGCGTGSTALRLAPLTGHYLATDISPNMIAIGREKAEAAEIADLDFAVASLETLEAAPGTFDAVLAFSMLHLLPDRAGAFARIRALLRPGGAFLSKTPCMAETGLIIRLLVPVLRMVGLAPRFARLSGAQLTAEIVAAGFEVVETARHGSGKQDIRLFVAARRPLAD